MFKMQWEHRAKQSVEIAKEFAVEALAIEKKIGDILDKLMTVSNSRVISAYEGRIDDLERQKRICVEKSENAGQSKVCFGDMIEHAFMFFSNPEKMWKSNRLDLQRLTLRLAFAGPLSYDRETGVLNTNLSLPFRVLGKNFTHKGKVAETKGFEPSMGL